jgi:hypothetical protein
VDISRQPFAVTAINEPSAFSPRLRVWTSVASHPLPAGSNAAGDLIVVQLDEKSDHRESRMATGNMFGAGHGGFDPKRTVTVATVKKEDGSWDVSPAQDLKPGEYLLTTGMSPQGFDFGVTK